MFLWSMKVAQKCWRLNSIFGRRNFFFTYCKQQYRRQLSDESFSVVQSGNIKGNLCICIKKNSLYYFVENTMYARMREPNITTINTTITTLYCKHPITILNTYILVKRATGDINITIFCKLYSVATFVLVLIVLFIT